MDRKELEEIKSFADGGDVQSCLLLGLIYYDGDEACQNSKEAFKYFSKAEKSGNALAAYYAGLCCYYGHGAPVSDEKAYKLFKKAAKGGCQEAQKALDKLEFREHALVVRGRAGDAEACCYLARHYRNRKYDDLEYKEANSLELEWYSVAAARDDPQALLGLAYVYERGYAVKQGDIQDEVKSLGYELMAYRSAKKAVEADGNNAYAKYWLGRCLKLGLGCDRDEKRGDELIRQAEGGGYSHVDSMVNDVCAEEQAELGEKYRSEARKAEWPANREENAEKSAAEAREKYEYSMRFFEGAVKNGNVYARYDLAEFYFEGITVEKDYAKAVKILKLVAKCTHGDHRFIWKGNAAARMLGDVYSTGGYGVERDDNKAFHWYYSAAERGNPRACTKVGNAYFYGVGTERDYAAAAYWYSKAVFDYDDQMYYGSDDGYDYEANVGLGDCYRLGLGVEKDEKWAFHLYDDVSKYTSDCPSADERVARCYYFGIGVEKDEKEAKGLWELAAGNGDEDAKAALREYFNVG